jgi:hypothetical protein
MQWESGQVALMPAYKNATADQAARPSGGGGACVQNAHAVAVQAERKYYARR